MQRRVMLLEFVTHERWVFDSRFFPFVEGCAQSLGAEVHWWCYGVEARLDKTDETTVIQYVDLNEKEREDLAVELVAFAPTHLLTSHRLSRELLSLIERCVPGLVVGSTSDHHGPEGVRNFDELLGAGGAASPGRPPGSRDGSSQWLAVRTDWILDWLGESRETCPLFDRFLVGTVAPSYGAHMANEAAVRFRPHVLVLGGITCDHMAKVAPNPHYAGIDLSICEQDFGCAYCTWFRGPTSDMDEDPVALAMGQLRRLAETQRGRLQGFVDLLDVRVLRHIERFAEQVVSLDLPPTTFCFEPRVDRALQVASRLDRALTTLATKGHGVYFFRMGAESLVEEENELFNKHVSLAQLVERPRRMSEIRLAHPDNFDFDPSWGFITCSPWTSLEMLRTNFERAIEWGFEPDGVWLYTPLLLNERAPITLKARAEGLVTEAFPDLSLLYEPSVNGVSFASLIPWRFRDERTGHGLALVVRFCAAALRGKYPDTIFDGDALYESLLRRLPAQSDFGRPDLFAREVLTLLAEGADGRDREALLAQALPRYAVALAGSPPRGRDGAAESIDAGAGTALRAEAMRRAVETVLARLGEDFAAVKVSELRLARAEAGYFLDIEMDGRRYALKLMGPQGRGFLRTRHMQIAHGPETPPESDADLRRLRRLFEVIDRALARHAPYLLPGEGP